jgi:peptidyl-prolyl cis-trans isomerase C
LSALVMMTAGLAGQEASNKTPSAPMTPPAATAVAATVNGQSILEMAVFRALCRNPPKDMELARKEVINYLVDNVLVDQYLNQLKIAVDSKDVDQKIEQIKEEAKKNKTEFENILKSLFLTEPELRKEMTCALRWDRFVEQQATEKNLKDLFDKNINMFDGSQVQARHILFKSEQSSPEQMVAKIALLKKQIEDEVGQEFAKLTPEYKTEKEKARTLERVFGRVATKESICPSKENGGDLGWFPRAGAMVEPFARAAFALKPFQMSDPVLTEFGYHLILTTDHKPGKDVKFEEVKPFVQEVYSERLREAVIAAMRPQSKIVIHPAAK